eukprot:CCRYP_005641-RA/>CCRYP_005641-RA protein AED:0.46 eAED:0.46 QI:0/-1/0/1/-1/1/1/0/131
MLCLAFALAATEATGEYKNTLREWHAKSDTNKTKHSKTSAHQNKQFEQMMEMMKTLMHSNGTHKAPNQPSLASNLGGRNENKGRGRGSSRLNRMKRCPHCKWLVYHKPEKCFKLIANAAKRPAGWKSVKET